MMPSMKQPPPALPGMKPAMPEMEGDEKEMGGGQLDRIERLLEQIAEAMGIDAEGQEGHMPMPEATGEPGE
jgi:hypothetical protein